MILLGLEWTGTILCIIGGAMVAHKNIYGFHLQVLADIILMIYTFETGQYGLFLLSLTYTFINAYGIYKWRKTDKPVDILPSK